MSSSTDRERDGRPRPSVVLVGASSGGLQSLRAVLTPLPADFALPIVVAQHMDRRHASRFPKLLARHVRVRVVEATHGARLQARTVHVVPPGRELSIARGDRIALLPCRDLPPACPSIDRMISSVVEDARTAAFGAITLASRGTGMVDAVLSTPEIASALVQMAPPAVRRVD